MHGITATVVRSEIAGFWTQQPVRTGPNCRTRLTVMELVLLLFFVLIAVASAAGLTVDSRDSADWKPTVEGLRAARRP